MFCRENETPLAPDRVPARSRELARDAGLPVVKLHEGGHTAAADKVISLLPDRVNDTTERRLNLVTSRRKNAAVAPGRPLPTPSRIRCGLIRPMRSRMTSSP